MFLACFLPAPDSVFFADVDWPCLLPILFSLQMLIDLACSRLYSLCRWWLALPALDSFLFTDGDWPCLLPTLFSLQMVIDLVLATDMKQRFALVKQLNTVSQLVRRDIFLLAFSSRTAHTLKSVYYKSGEGGRVSKWVCYGMIIRLCTHSNTLPVSIKASKLDINPEAQLAVLRKCCNACVTQGTFSIYYRDQYLLRLVFAILSKTCRLYSSKTLITLLFAYLCKIELLQYSQQLHTLSHFHRCCYRLSLCPTAPLLPLTLFPN
jgi:hypothetical protein